jgi:two-component system sensor kinase FixL
LDLISRVAKLAEVGISRPWSARRAIAFSSLFLAMGAAVGVPLGVSLERPELNVFLLPSIVLAAGLGGFFPGLLMTVLAIITDTVIDSWIGQRAPSIPINLAYLGTGVLMSVGGHLFRQSLINAGAMYAELQKREADLRAIVDTVPDSLVVIDEQGLIVRFSPGAEAQFGWRAEEALGQNVAILMPSPFREQHQAHVERYNRLGSSDSIGRSRLLTGLRKDGSTFPIELSLGQLSIDDRHHYVGFIRDLTERHDAEQRMQELQTELFHVSRLSALGQLASAIAHEINQPLAAIANYIAGAKKLAAGGTDPEALQEALEHAAREAIRAGETIRKLRAFLSRGETDMRPEKLTALIDEAIAIAMTGNNTRKIRLQTRMSPSIVNVVVDKVQIQQVLLNLIRNGMEAMNETTKRQMIIETAPHDHGMAVISVIDSGVGLSEEAQDQLFKPFVTSKSSGMGIGLSITRSIVEAHGGRIWTEPNPDGGAIFRFTVRQENSNEAPHTTNLS